MKAAPVFVLLLLTVSPVAADGLLYSLPEDGAWVTYDLTMSMERDDQQRESTGKLKMSSVGKAVIDGVDCRWLEFSLTMKVNSLERTTVCKVLIPESELKEGGDPLANRIRGWIRLGRNSEPADLTDDKLGPMPTFMAKEFADQAVLPAEEISSKLGKLNCSGVSGNVVWEESGSSNSAKCSIRKHAKAAFGVVAADIRISSIRGNGTPQAMQMKLKLRDFGFDASTELPGSK